MRQLHDFSIGQLGVPDISRMRPEIIEVDLKSILTLPVLQLDNWHKGTLILGTLDRA